MNSRLPLLRVPLAMAVLVLASACATVPAGPAVANPVDPWERWNRKVFAFNDAIDEAVLKPVAQAYRDVVPELVRTGVGNFFGNIADVWSAANHVLQGKVGSGLEMGMRVLTNTLFGLGGLLDPATEARLPRRSEDFGQTLGVWGLPAGPYLVLPLLGPSSVRDAAGLPLDRYATMTQRVVDAEAWVMTALQLVNVRSELLATTQLLSDVSLDRYSFIRDGYLARRLDQVWDGAPPMDAFEDIGDDPPPPPSPPPSTPPSPPSATTKTGN
jgi:phospholipid-binding lipoprotein MlaA